MHPSAPGNRRWKQAAVGLALLGLVLWSGDFLLTVYAKYRHVDPDTYTMFWPRRGWLWIHLAGGALALTLGLVQFFTQWPRAYHRVHRWTGRGYLAGMLIASTGATGLIATSPAPFAIRLAFAVTALAWLGTALMGLRTIGRGQVQAHRRWMIRAYLVTLAPITFRLWLHTPGVLALADPPDVIATLLWLSWAVPLLGYEVGRRGLGRLRPRTGALAATAAALPRVAGASD